MYAAYVICIMHLRRLAVNTISYSERVKPHSLQHFALPYQMYLPVLYGFRHIPTTVIIFNPS